MLLTRGRRMVMPRVGADPVVSPGLTTYYATECDNYLVPDGGPGVLVPPSVLPAAGTQAGENLRTITMLADESGYGSNYTVFPYNPGQADGPNAVRTPIVQPHLNSPSGYAMRIRVDNLGSGQDVLRGQSHVILGGQGTKQKLHVRMYFAVPIAFDFPDIAKYIRFWGPGHVDCGVFIIAANDKWQFGADGQQFGAYAQSTVGPTKDNQFHHTEVMIDWSLGTTLTVAMWYDQVQIMSATRAVQSFTAGIREVEIFGTFNNRAVWVTPVDFYYSRIKMANEYIGTL